ncbi:AraC family transcriptional regulator [Pedosphaera parvula]|uniref:Transcriptional regulator, AraC family n=1 Tax=Pedosphaera parvula (strain Ellin514) TaxID=320771 RepID=B9XCZ4_PEDPL|nr:DNA-binding transcriptional regulator [Pedosphaera parvula]EEF62340.1 transcriptional regulator, AraC family [Pedosphaera parvula Ellin514]
MSKRREVALLIETSNAYARGVLQGVVRYIRENSRWSFYLPEQGRGDIPPGWLANWQGDGIIARIENQEIARSVAASGLPAVDVSAARMLPSLPWVETDDRDIARLAAEHLLDRGFKHFGFCGDARFNWSNWRAEHFEKAIHQAGRECQHYRSTISPVAPLENQVAEIAQWLVKLPKPVAIMACYDIRGQQVLDACRNASLAVPDEVAVIGVDDDTLLCDLSSPPLSSVIPNTQRTGYEAAALLDQMMSGRKVPPTAHLITPLGVATRQSTDVLAIEDRHIARAVRFIREHAHEQINIEAVLKVVPLSRRVFEGLFKKILGHTPHEEIIRVRMNRVKELLTETELNLATIAERTGFEHVEYLSTAFKKKAGLSPNQYRAKNRKFPHH